MSFHPQMARDFLEDDVPGDRRRSYRYPVKWSVELFEPIHGAQTQARAANLSLEGCYLVDVTEPIEVDTIIRLQLQNGSETVDLWAQVIRSAGERELGAKFLATCDGDYAILDRWLRESGTRSES